MTEGINESPDLSFEHNPKLVEEADVIDITKSELEETRTDVVENSISSVSADSEKINPKKINKLIKQGNDTTTYVRNALNKLQGNDINNDVMQDLQTRLTYVIDDFSRHNITIEENKVIGTQELSNKQTEEVRKLFSSLVLLQEELTKRKILNEQRKKADDAVDAFEADPENDTNRETAEQAIYDLVFLVHTISKYPEVAPESVAVGEEIKVRFRKILEKHGYTRVDITTDTGESIPFNTTTELDRYFIEKKNMPRETLDTIQSAIVGDIGTMARPATMAEIAEQRGPVGDEYAQKYAQLYYNHSLGLKHESEGKFLSAFAELVEDAGDTKFGTKRDIRRFAGKMKRINKKEQKKLEIARDALAHTIQRACARHYLRRSLDISDHLMQMQSHGPDHHHGLPVSHTKDIWGTNDGRDIMLFAQNAFGEDRHAEISAILGNDDFVKKVLPPGTSVGVLYPTQGIESYLAKEGNTDRESTIHIRDGKLDMYPGSPAEALTRYLQKYNSRTIEGDQDEVISPTWATFLIQRRFKTGDAGYDLIGALEASGSTTKEAQKIAHQILKDAFRANGGWRTKMRYEYAQLSDNYRANLEKLHPGADYSERTKDDIPIEDGYRLWSLAAINATSAVFGGREEEKGMARQRLSEIWEDGTTAWNPIDGVSNGLGNEIVGEQMMHMLDEVDGKGTGDWQDRYLGGLSNDGHFVGAMNSAETIFNNAAKDVLGLDDSAAHKLGKVANIATGAALIYGGWKLLKWAWNGGKDGSSSRTSRLGRFAVLGGAGYFLGNEIKSAIWGGEFGKSGVGKKVMSLFGVESKYGSAEGLSPVQTLGMVFGSMKTADVLDMFTLDKNGIFVLNKDAIQHIKKVQPGMSDVDAKNIQTILQDPGSQLNTFLSGGLKNIGITKKTYDDVKNRYGSMQFQEYMDTYIAGSHITKDLLDLGVEGTTRDQLTQSLQQATPEEAELIKSRIEEMKLYGTYYPDMRAKLQHALTYRALPSTITEDDKTALLDALKDDNMTLYHTLLSEYTMAKSTTSSPHGFSKSSTFPDFITTLNKEIYGGHPAMQDFLDHTKGKQEMDAKFGTRDEAFMSDYKSPEWYLNRTTGEQYTEKLLKVGNHEVFISINQTTESINGSTGPTKSNLSFRVPDGTGWEEMKLTKMDGHDLFIKGLGYDDTGRLVTDMYRHQDMLNGTTIDAYKEHPFFSTLALEEIVNQAARGDSTVQLSKQQHLDPSLANITTIPDTFDLTLQATGARKP